MAGVLVPRAQLREILKDQMEKDAAVLVDPAVRYTFLPFLGLAYRVKDEQVAEIVLAPVARQADSKK